MKIIKINNSIYFSAIVVEDEDGKIIMHNPIPKEYRALLDIL